MRVKRSVTARNRHKKILKMAKGYSKARRSSYRKANEAVIKALSYQYRDRRNRKRDFRSLWITRISAAAKANGTSYSVLMDKLSKAKVGLNRKMLSEVAARYPEAFSEIVKSAK